jgi:hypothetical protein
MQPELRLRRAASAATVLLLHILALLALLAAFRPQTFFGARQATREITITLPPTPVKTPRIERLPSIPPPEFLTPEISPRAITPPALEALPAQPETQEPQGDLRALGRYLYNCSGAYYERLSPREKAHCIENKWYGKEGPVLTLGPAKPSPYDAVLAKRNAPAVPIERPCPTDKPTANLGMPCYDFNGNHQPLVQFQH